MADAVHIGSSMFLRRWPFPTGTVRRLKRTRRALVASALGLLFLGAIPAQQPDTDTWESKLNFHAATAYSPLSLVGAAAYSGVLQGVDFPREWGQGGLGYGKRLASELAYAGVRNTMGFALDATLHEDPRYYRSKDSGFWRRTKHAFRGTILTRTDAGGETLSWWRLGSAFGATYISNQWYPDRVNTVALDLTQGTTQMGFDFLANFSAEFWPDIKKKVFRRKP